MGLDTVELVMEVEETFGIRISDRDGERITTVGELYEFVIGRVNLAEVSQRRCMSAVAFYRLRRAMMGSLDIARDRVRPSTDVEGLVAADDRRSSWQRLEHGLELTLPRLVRPRWVWGLSCVAFLSCVRSLVLLYWHELLPDALTQFALLSLWLSVALLVLVQVTTRPLAVHLPSGCESVGGLVTAIVHANLGPISAAAGGWSAPDVWDAILAVVAEHAGVPRERLTAETSFVHDLGMD